MKTDISKLINPNIAISLRDQYEQKLNNALLNDKFDLAKEIILALQALNKYEKGEKLILDKSRRLLSLISEQYSTAVL